MSRSCPATLRSILLTLAALAAFPAALVAQQPAPPASSDSGAAMGAADMAMGGMHDMRMGHDHESATAMLHMRMTPTRPATAADSARARRLAAEIRGAIARYADTTAAVADGYRMFLPRVKQQRIYHYTSWRHAVAESFRFDPAKPTSILYEHRADGTLRLVGAMYTMPRRTTIERLDERIPLSIGRWHQHVAWCLPPRGEGSRWSERRDGKPLFGPESPIATKSACDAVGGDFHDVLFGWMIHANVFAGDDLATIFGEP